MKEAGDVSLARERQAWAEMQDWSHRAQEFDRVIQASYPKVSIFVLSYRHWEMTVLVWRALNGIPTIRITKSL